jgi:hypothetical protein
MTADDSWIDAEEQPLQFALIALDVLSDTAWPERERR